MALEEVFGRFWGGFGGPGGSRGILGGPGRGLDKVLGESWGILGGLKTVSGRLGPQNQKN